MNLRNIKFKRFAKYAIRKTRIKIANYNKKRGGALILGAYDGYNAGDIALLRSSINIAEEKDLEYETKNIKRTNLKDINRENEIIFGGGATYTLRVAKNISQQSVSIDPSKVTLMGVDVQGADEHYSEGVVSFMNDMNWISVRQKKQKKILDRKVKGVVWHPDISFTLYHKFDRSGSDDKVMGINVMPFMAMRNGLKWKCYYPWSKLSEGEKGEQTKAKKLSEKYIKFMRSLVKQAIDRGYRVWHHPFALQDELFARSIFQGLNIKHQKYTPDLNKNIERFAEYSRMIASRLHAHIFAMMREIPIISFAYSHKCVSLFEDLKKSAPEKQLSRYNILQHEVEEIDLDSLLFHPGGMAENANSKVKKCIKEIEWDD